METNKHNCGRPLFTLQICMGWGDVRGPGQGMGAQSVLMLMLLAAFLPRLVALEDRLYIILNTVMRLYACLLIVLGISTVSTLRLNCPLQVPVTHIHLAENFAYFSYFGLSGDVLEVSSVDFPSVCLLDAHILRDRVTTYILVHCTSQDSLCPSDLKHTIPEVMLIVGLSSRMVADVMHAYAPKYVYLHTSEMDIPFAVLRPYVTVNHHRDAQGHSYYVGHRAGLSLPLDYIQPSPPNVVHMSWSTHKPLGQLQHIVVKRLLQHHPRSTILVHTNVLHQGSFADKSLNIKLRAVDGDLFTGTPLMSWWLAHASDYSALVLGTAVPAGKYFYSHVTDAIRLAALYKFGGIYLDFDVLVLRNLQQFHNALGIESDKPLLFNFAVAMFQQQHPFIWLLMHNFIMAYNPMHWACVGPDLVTRGVLTWNHTGLVDWSLSTHPITKNTTTTTYSTVPRIAVYPRATFYPIHWLQIDAARLHRFKWWCRTSQHCTVDDSAAVHLWSHMGWSMRTVQAGSILDAVIHGNAYELKRALATTGCSSCRICHICYLLLLCLTSSFVYRTCVYIRACSVQRSTSLSFPVSRALQASRRPGIISAGRIFFSARLGAWSSRCSVQSVHLSSKNVKHECVAFKDPGYTAKV